MFPILTCKNKSNKILSREHLCLSYILIFYGMFSSLDRGFYILSTISFQSYCDTVRLSACILCNIMSLYLIAVYN